MAGGCDPTPILQKSCSGVACHGFPGEPARFNTDLFNPPADQTLGQSLTGKLANYNLIADPTKCPTANPEQLINPSAPAESLILTKLMGTQTCGLTMPNNKAGATLPQSEIDCFVSWVNAVVSANAGTLASNTATGTSTTGTSTTGAGGATSTSTAATTTGVLGPIPAATYDTLVFVLTMNQLNCTSSDCHGGIEGHIDLRPDAPGVPPLYERLTTWNSDVCGKLVVRPGSPDQSALLQVLTTGCGNVVPKCSIGTECIPRMPLDCQDGTDCIPPEYVEALRQWIATGAPQ